MKIDWFAVFRDILIVAVLGTLGTLAIGFVLGDITAQTQLVLAFVMLTAGFTLSGSLKGPGRFKHLMLVALGVWIVVLLDGVLRAPERVPGILMVGTLSVAVATLVGGALSLVVRRDGSAPSPPVE